MEFFHTTDIADLSVLCLAAIYQLRFRLTWGTGKTSSLFWKWEIVQNIILNWTKLNSFPEQKFIERRHKGSRSNMTEKITEYSFSSKETMRQVTSSKRIVRSCIKFHKKRCEIAWTSYPIDEFDDKIEIEIL